jgi:hypothetical protein
MISESITTRNQSPDAVVTDGKPLLLVICRLVALVLVIAAARVLAALFVNLSTPTEPACQLVGCETVQLLTATVPPAMIDVESSVMSPPPPVAVTLPSITAVPAESYPRNQPAVPVASAVVSDVIALAVATLGLAVVAFPNAGSLNVRVASNVPDAAVFAVAGCEPVRISM